MFDPPLARLGPVVAACALTAAVTAKAANAPTIPTPRRYCIALPTLRRARAPVQLLEALGEIAERERVAVLDPAVPGVEELEKEVRDSERLELAPESIRTEVEIPLVARARVDVDR